MSELWSPAMRKWARDAHRHGIDIGFAKTRPSRKDMWGGGNAYTDRVTDDGNVRIVDDVQNALGGWPRRIDHPVLR